MRRKEIRELYEEIGPEFSITRAKPSRSLKKALRRIKLKGIVLDAGAGNGRNLSLLERRGVKRILALEFTKILSKECKKRVEKEGLRKVDIIMGDICYLPFRDLSIDIGVYSAVLHHLSLRERERAYREIERVIRKGVVITCWSIKAKERREVESTIDGYYIPWKRTRRGVIMRYYHLYTSNELEEELLKNFINKKIEILEEGEDIIGIIKRK